MKANSTYIRVLASALSTTSGVRVEEGENWAFDSKKKVLTYNPITLLEKPVEVVRGILLHEIGHVMYTRPVKSSEIYAEYPAINFMYNAFEDARIERKLKDEYRDFAREPLFTKSMNGVGKFFEKNSLVSQPKSYQIASVASMVDLMMQILNGEVYENSYEERRLFEKIRRIELDLGQYVDKDVLDAAEEIQRKVDWTKLVKIARTLPDFATVQKMVDKEVFPYIKHLLENDPTNESMKQAMAAKQQQQSQSGQGQGEGEEGEGQGQEAMAQGQEGGDQEAEVIMQNQDGDEAGTGTEAFSRTPRYVPGYVEAAAMVSPYTNFLASRIKDIMKENTAIAFHGNHRSGKLLSRNVTKLTMGEERVFSKRNQIDSPKHHLIVALDASGSMDGEKMHNAYLGTVLALDTFRKIRMPYTVLEFGEEVNYLVEEGKVDPRFLNYRSQGGGTDDAEMVRQVAEYMRRKPDEEFLFIIIGDGCGVRLPKKELEYIQSRSVPLAIGIGRGAQQVAHAYPGGVHVDDVTKVPQVVLSTLHEYIHR